MKSSCALEKDIGHSKIKDKFKNTFIFCPAFEKDTGSMIHTGLLCAGCCLRVQFVCEAMGDLILRRQVTREDLQRDPNCFYPLLTDSLREYAEVVSKVTGKTWLEISSECSRCKVTPVEPMEVPEAEATEMIAIHQRDV